jgi:hypothetical protein
MTNIETIINAEESNDLRDTQLKKGDHYSVTQVVTETYYERGKLTRFVTIRRDGKGITELRYNVHSQTGKPEVSGVGVFFSRDTPPYHASQRYAELNEFLEELGK